MELYKNIYKELNEMILNGKIIVDYAHFVWGVKSCHTENDKISMKCKEYKFLGGGISLETFIVTNQIAEHKFDNSIDAIECFYSLLKN